MDNTFSEHFSIWRVSYLASFIFGKLPKTMMQSLPQLTKWNTKSYKVQWILAFVDVLVMKCFRCPLALNTSDAKGRWPIHRTYTPWHAAVADSSSARHANTLVRRMHMCVSVHSEIHNATIYARLAGLFSAALNK